MGEPSSMTDAPVAAGDLLAGKYRVERVLGSGGMGVVVAAVHVELGQRVAVKFLLPHAVQSPEAASRFLREARAAVRIESEHVARVLDVGRLENGAPYLVMEYLEGSDLSQYPRGEQLPIEAAVDFVLQACAAMAVAHTAGIVHRDLKPANLFLTSRPDGSTLLKVLDFGISKVSLLEAPAVVTQASALMGSPLYMSPEQACSARNVDGRTDIWSLGVILYELLTGVPPFGGQSLTEVLTAVMTATPAPIHALRAGVPPGLEQAVMRALEKPVERRFANIGELSAALVEFAPPTSRLLHDRVSGVLNRAGLSSVPPPIPSQGARVPPAPVVSGTDMTWIERGKRSKKPVRVSLVLGAAIALALGAGLFAYVFAYARAGNAGNAGNVGGEAPPLPSNTPVAAAATPSTAAGVPAESPVVSPAGQPAAPPEIIAEPPPAPPTPLPAVPTAARAHPPTRAPVEASVTSAAPRKRNPLSIDFK